jgi:dihydrofolate reductase
LFQVPIFVVTHTLPLRPSKETGRLTFTFVTDGIDSAITQAQTAARSRQVTVIGGASTARQCIRAGLADELHLDIMPVILGGGLRLFEGVSVAHTRLERLKDEPRLFPHDVWRGHGDHGGVHFLWKVRAAAIVR